MSALWSLMSPRAVIGRERGASIELVPLLWNSHSCDCLRCSDHVDLCRIECDNGTMPYAHRPMPEFGGLALALPPSARASALLWRGQRQ